jgi:[ribosomal protein S5]-alanine N-acetyltransferase
MVTTAERRMVGRIGFHGPPQAGVAEIGYAVEPEERRRGYATEAIQAMMAWAFSTGDVVAIRAAASPHNSVSLRLLQTFGFEKSGSQWDDRDGHEDVYLVERAGFEAALALTVDTKREREGKG